MVVRTRRAGDRPAFAVEGHEPTAHHQEDCVGSGSAIHHQEVQQMEEGEQSQTVRRLAPCQTRIPQHFRPRRSWCRGWRPFQFGLAIVLSLRMLGPWGGGVVLPPNDYDLAAPSFFHYTSPQHRPHAFRIWQKHWRHQWSRWKTARVAAPHGYLAASLPTRRSALHLLPAARPSLDREIHLVQWHLELLERDMGKNASKSAEVTEMPATTVLIWSGTYPFWFAKVPKTDGEDRACSIPCHWTRDRNALANATGIVCLLYRDQCQDIPTNLAPHIPILGVTWENDWRRVVPSHVDELPSQQLDRLQQHVPYNLISSYELDSHIPVLYREMLLYMDRFRVQTKQELLEHYQTREKAVAFTISNCEADIHPDRLAVIQQLSKYYPTESYGQCLGKVSHQVKAWNARHKIGQAPYVAEMSRFTFMYTPENSIGLDYVTEKVFHALAVGAVPIYMGAPNIAAFLPDRDAVIHVSDFDSVEELADYLHRVSENTTLLVERHLAWRAQPLPRRLDDLVRLVDERSPSTFMCKVCHCMRGRIGCPTLRNTGHEYQL